MPGNLLGDWCDQHCVASQPVRRLETLPPVTSEMPANGGLLRIGYRSPGSEIGRCGSEIADSLRRIFEIFPFSGDSDRRRFDRDCVTGNSRPGVVIPLRGCPSKTASMRGI